jgi:hypothetical protein
VGGQFNTAGTQTRHRLAAIDLATGLATPWDPSPDFPVTLLHVNGGTVYAAGNFTHIGGQDRYRLAALDAAGGWATSWNPNPGPDLGFGETTIYAIATSGSDVYIGGIFGRMGGRERTGFAVVDSSTAVANFWDHYVSHYALALAVDGSSVYIGGFFASIDNQPRNGLAVMDKTSGLLSPYTLHFPASTSGILTDGGAIYLAGNFTTVHQTFVVLSKTVTTVASDLAPPASMVRATPNPFRQDVSLLLSMPHSGNLEVTVYDVAGRVVRRLEQGSQDAGVHRVHWDGRDEAGHQVASGIYLARAESAGMRVTTKVLKVE